LARSASSSSPGLGRILQHHTDRAASLAMAQQTQQDVAGLFALQMRP